MVRMKQYEPGVSVLDAARARIDATLEECDRLVVAFSGGKDSLVVLHLVRERMLARGDRRPVAAVYRDQEFVNGSIIDKVAETFALEWVDGRWLALQVEAQTTILGEPVDHVIWDPSRPHHRALPPEAIQDPHRVYDAPGEDLFIANLWPGRVVIATGLRTEESLIRYRSVANKISEPWLAKSKANGVTLCRPIYDWLEMDVLKYLDDEGIEPAGVYHAQGWHGGELRTSALTAVEQIRDVARMRATDPDAYAALIEAYPDAATMGRYDAEMKDRLRIGKRAESYLEVRRWIDQRYEPGTTAHRHAMARYKFAMRLVRNNPEGVPPWWIQREIARNGHGSGLLPLPANHPSRRKKDA